MDTNQNSSIEMTITPAMCMAVLAEITAVRCGMSPDEVEAYDRHEACSGYDLVAARLVRAAIRDGLSQRKLVEWAAGWADKTEDASNTFEERRAVATIRGFVSSVPRFNFDQDNEDERIELEKEVCALAEESRCTAVLAWKAVFEGAIWMAYESLRDDRTWPGGEKSGVGISAAEMVMQLMFHACSDDAERNEMMSELRALVDADRAERSAGLCSTAMQGGHEACAVSNHNAIGQAELAHDARS
ncbi:MAG: hypothetical protein RLZZ450_302 [Pseudomonadota bacterium]|jgi:hypothetical protein